LNILRIVYDFPPPWGGLSPGPYELSKAQIRIGNRVTVLAGEWPRQKSYSEDGLKVERLPATLPYVSLFLTYAPSVLVKYLFKIKCNIDTIHGHCYHPVFYHFYRKLFKDRIPYVLHMNITSAERAYRNKKVPFFTKYFEWQLAIEGEKLGCQLADAIICVSESVREEVMRWYSPAPEKVYTVPNGVNTELFNPEGQNMRSKLNLENSKVILYVGRLCDRKNVNILIKSLKHLNEDFKLLIIGEGQDRKKLIELTKTLGLEKRVIFAGFVPYPELPYYYLSANVFVLPSEFEGFPKVVLESLSSGIPVISSKSFRGDNFLTKNVTWLDNVTPIEIAKKIKYITEQNYRVNIESIKNNYDWKSIAQRIQAIYRKIC